jgi:hypothetical protein
MAVGRSGFDAKTWLMWTLALVAFPPAGLIARAVAGPANSFGAALFSGAVAGLVIGAGTWIALGRAVPVIWIPLTAVGLAVGLALGASLVGFRTSIGDLMIMGAVTGFGVGLAQWWILRGWLRQAVLWPLGMALTWAIGWYATTAIGVNVSLQWPVFGLVGAVVAMALSGALLAVLKRAGGPPTDGPGIRTLRP